MGSLAHPLFSSLLLMTHCIILHPLHKLILAIIIPLVLVPITSSLHHPLVSRPWIPPQPSICLLKLQLNSFDGQDPLDWLFQAKQVFAFYQVPPELCLSMTMFYMRGESLSWFKWMHHNHQLMDWETFIYALEVRFRPLSYENHQAELFKFYQYSTTTEYQHHFENLSNRVFELNA